MKDKIVAHVYIESKGGGATFTIPYDKNGRVVEQAAKYMLTVCGWQEALVEDDVDDLEGMVKRRKVDEKVQEHSPDCDMERLSAFDCPECTCKESE